MKEDKEIDKLFKEKLGNLGSHGIPPSFLDDINDRLDNLEVPDEKKKRRALWLWFIPFAGIVSAVFYFNMRSSDSAFNRKDKNNGSTVNNSNQPEENIEKPLTENSRNGADNNGKREPVNVSIDNSEQVDETTSKTKEEENTIINEKSPLIEPATVINSKKIISSEKKASQKPTKNEGLANDKTTAIVANKNKKIKSEGSDVKKIKESDHADSIAKITPEELKIQVAEPKIIAKTDSATTSIPDSVVQQNELTKKDTKSDSVATLSVDSIKKDPPDYIESKKLELSSLQLSAGGLKALSVFDFKNSALMNKTPENSKAVMVVDIGAQAIFKKNKLYYSTGFNYNQWSEPYSYDLSVSSTTTETNVIGFQQITSYPISYQNMGHTDAFGNFILDSVITIVDTVVQTVPITVDEIVEHKDSVSKKGTDKYNYVSIPISIGFQLGSNTFVVLPKIGGNIAFPVRAKTYYTNSQLMETNERIKAPIVLNLELSIDFTVNYRSFGFSIIPLYRRSMYYVNEAQNVSNKFSGAGVKAGISYYFK